MKTADKIVENKYVKYIGFLLIIRDLIVIVRDVVSLKMNFLNVDFFVNLAIDIFIGAVIYQLINLYKLKADRDDFDTTVRDLEKINYDHALHISFLESLLISNEITENKFDTARNFLEINAIKYLGFKETQIEGKTALSITRINPVLEKNNTKSEGSNNTLLEDVQIY